MRNGERLAITEIETGGFVTRERPGASTAEDGDLISALIDGTISIDSLRDGQGRSAGAKRSDQFRRGSRAETIRIRGIFRRQDLQHSQTVLSIRYEGESAGNLRSRAGSTTKALEG